MKDYYIDFTDLTFEIDDEGFEVYDDGHTIIEANDEVEAKQKFQQYAEDNLNNIKVEILSCEEY